MSGSNNVNPAAGIAIQVVPTILWGETGVGKTASIRSLVESLGRTFIHMNAATHVAEDFSGFPNPDYEAGVVRMMPPSWVEDSADGNAAIMLDELTCTQQATLAGALTLLSDNMVGEYRLPATTLKVAAANPPELAPNSAPLPASICSRFVHLDWQIDREALLTGYRNGCDWDAPNWPIVPENWDDFTPYWGAIVEQFLRAHPDALCQMPADDSVRSFPTPRGYEFVVRTLAAAKACGFEDSSAVCVQLVTGCIGEVTATQFMKYVRTLDLVDPAAIVEGREEYEFTDRVDLNICLVTGLVQQLRNHTSRERWLNAAEVFATLAENGQIETVLLAFSALWRDEENGGVRPTNYLPPEDLQARLLAAIQ